MKFKINCTFSLFIFLLPSLSNAQSPWVREKHKTYLQIGGSFIGYESVVLDNKMVSTGRSNYDITSQIYAEYGVFKNTEVSLIIPFKMMGYEDPAINKTAEITGFGNIQIGAKYLLIDKKFKLAGGITVSMNSIQHNATIGLRTGFNSNTFQPFLTLGTSKNKLYYYVLGGYAFMDNDYSDYMRLSGEAGYEIYKKLHLIVATELKKATTNESFFNADKPSYVATASYLDRQEYFSIGIKINYEFTANKAGATFSAFGAPYLNNVAAAPSFNLSVYRKF